MSGQECQQEHASGSAAVRGLCEQERSMWTWVRRLAPGSYFAIIDCVTLAKLNPLGLYFFICRVGGITTCQLWKDC